MPRYVAFLRGVSPMNCRMPALQACLEAAGFGKVRTLLSSGNVAFDARSAPIASLERRLEAAMLDGLGRSFETYVRSTQSLQAFLASEPFAPFALPAGGKRVVTFLRTPADPGMALPPERDGARILKVLGTEALAVYVPGPKGPVFMTVLEKAFGKQITTRTLDTVRKCAAA